MREAVTRITVITEETGFATIYTREAPRRAIGTIVRTFDATGRWTGWKISSSGGKWWATCPGSFNDAKAIARHHFARMSPYPGY